jgi:hypothetical protein
VWALNADSKKLHQLLPHWTPNKSSAPSSLSLLSSSALSAGVCMRLDYLLIKLPLLLSVPS